MIGRGEVEALCLARPAATKVVLFHDRTDVYKVAGKVFAVCSDDEGLSFKASEIAYAVLTDGGPGRPAKGFARGRWISVALADLDAAEAAEWIAGSYATVAAGLPKAERRELGIA